MTLSRHNEVCIKGDNSEMVSNGVMSVLSKLSEETGKVMGGEWDVEEGGARATCDSIL